MYQVGYHKNIELSHATFLVYELLDSSNFPNYTINTILDVGCSHGKAVQQLWKGGKNASGVDISSVAVNRAISIRIHEKKHIQPRCVFGTSCFQTSSATSLPFRDRYFDALLSTDVLEHIEPHEVKRAVTELGRVTKRFLFLKIANRLSNDNELYKLKQKGISVPHNLHISIHETDKWLAEFERVGFKLHHKLEDHMKWIMKFPHMCCAFILERYW